MALGDALWIEPVIRQLAPSHRKVIVYTRYPELFLNYPLLSVRVTGRLQFLENLCRLLGKAIPATGLHIGLDNTYEHNPKVHILAAYQRAAGLPLTREYPRLYLSKEEKAFRPKEARGKKYVVLHLDRMPGQQNFRKVYGVDWQRIVAALSAMGFAVIVVGVHAVAIPGAATARTTLRELIALIHGSSFFIGLDSGPSHIAAALGVPALIMFGAVNPDFFHFKDLLRGFILQQPCEHAGCYHDCNNKVDFSCRLVGNTGIPKCALHSTAYVLDKINLLMEQYQLKKSEYAATRRLARYSSNIC